MVGKTVAGQKFNRSSKKVFLVIRLELVLGCPSASGLQTTAVVCPNARQCCRHRVKKDASGELVKDASGNFIFVPVYEGEQE